MARHGSPHGLTFDLVPEDTGDDVVVEVAPTQPPTVAPSLLQRAARRTPHARVAA